MPAVFQIRRRHRVVVQRPRHAASQPYPLTAAAVRVCLFALAALALLFTQGGCASRTYQRQVGGIVGELREGRPARATEHARELAKDSGETDRLLWQLEWGAAARAAADPAESLAAFDAALETLRALDAAARVSLSDEALAALNNLTSLTYRGAHSDRIFLSTYQALNYLQRGEFDKARVALNLTQQRQTEAVEDNAAKIEKAREDAARRDNARAQNQADINRTLNSPQFKGDMAKNYADTRAVQGYANYVNPFSTWLHGIYFLANATGASDIERAHKSLQRAAALSPDNHAAQADCALAREARERGTVVFPPVTYVIFETGLAPARKEFRIDVPLFIVGASRIPHVGVAFPRLESVRDYHPSLIVVPGGGVSQPTQVLADVDRIVTAEFKDALPEIITRTLINTLTKAAATYAINAAADEAARRNQNASSGIIFLTSRVATSLYSVLTTAADLRSWHTLPREIQIARIPTPPGGVLRIHLGNSPARRIPLADPTATARIIHIRSVSRATPPVITQFTLKQ